jgi:thiopeptide-type bacteriocin biosynthesis protein
MKTQRILIPGSEWVYFKFYTGIKSADALLINTIYPFIQSLKSQNITTQYFFIRYTDPHFHLRLRLQLSNENCYTEVFKLFYTMFNPCVENGLLWNIQLDTYKRELERYGSNTIETVESIFCIDSDSIIKLISALKHQQGDIHRWLLSLILIDDILSMAKYDLLQKEKFILTLSESFKQEFNFTTSVYKRQLGDKYRENKRTIEEVLNKRNESDLKAYIEYLEERTEQMKPYIEQLLIKNQENILPIPLDSLISSIIHMTMNRLFRSKNRLHEMVIYDFLHRYYKSLIARNVKINQ